MSSAVTPGQFPSPPAGKTGWPWTLEHSDFGRVKPDGEPWPRISIVTPSFNQAAYIEETIRSILLQGYPNLEYMVIDGGSTDGSVEIVRRYERWLTCWMSEADRGQAHAINKGLARATGEIFGWVNSDDLLMPGSLKHIGESFGDTALLAGCVENFDDDGRRTLVRQFGLSLETMLLKTGQASYHQPALWFRKTALDEVGPFAESFHYCFDYERLLQILRRDVAVRYSDRVLARFRLHPDSKTVSTTERFHREKRKAWRLLVSDSRFSEGLRTSLHGRIRSDRQRRAWYRYLTRIGRSPDHRLAKIRRILVHWPISRAHPGYRFLLGAVRNLLAGLR
jgi:glycosyltransferase involved in cell wall biosynthesis